MTIKAIFACDLDNGIGKNNDLPWPHNKNDMKWFKRNTTNHIVVMGRKTWDSLNRKPLPNRINVVISDTLEQDDRITIYSTKEYSFKDIFKKLEEKYPFKDIWIIGGAGLFKSTLPFCKFLYLTKFNQKYECDVFVDQKDLDPFTLLIDHHEDDLASYKIMVRNERIQ